MIYVAVLQLRERESERVFICNSSGLLFLIPHCLRHLTQEWGSLVLVPAQCPAARSRAGGRRAWRWRWRRSSINGLAADAGSGVAPARFHSALAASDVPRQASDRDRSLSAPTAGQWPLQVAGQ